MTRIIVAFAAIALAGCTGLRFENDPVPVAGTVWIAEPAITGTHPELDRSSIAERIHAAALKAVEDGGFAKAADEASADLVIRATIEDFWLGDETVRALGWRVSSHQEDRPSFQARVAVLAKGQPPNEARMSEVTDAGGWSKFNMVERRTTALIDKISRMHLAIAKEYRK
ncbi:MAG: hypothetical protein K8T20_17125 [Planctomycetes bacterium]|nr:hypothetical protein [Planctomycetota bacterium]